MRTEVDVEEHVAHEIMRKLEDVLSHELTENSVTLIKTYQQRLYEIMENLGSPLSPHVNRQKNYRN